LIKDKKEDLLEFLIWSFIGFGIIVVSIYPDVITYLFVLLGMSYRGNVIFAVGILLSYLLLLNIFALLRTLSDQISKLNEEIAILKYEFDKKR